MQSYFWNRTLEDNQYPPKRRSSAAVILSTMFPQRATEGPSYFNGTESVNAGCIRHLTAPTRVIMRISLYVVSVIGTFGPSEALVYSPPKRLFYVSHLP